MIRRVAALSLMIALALNAALAVWALSQNPFAQPFVARSEAAARGAIDRALAARATPDWLAAQAEDALADEDFDRLGVYLDLANDRNIALPPDLLRRVQAAEEARSGLWAQAKSCAACAYDIRLCPTIAEIGACALPVEITPLGDLNALRRAATDWAAGNDIDELDAGLGLIGLAATGAVIVTGGTSATAKIGATALRVGRRMGAVGTRLTAHMAGLTRGLVRWGELPHALRTGTLDTALDAARWTRLRHVAADFGTVAERTSTSEALVLLKHVDTPEDLSTLARLSTVEGGRTRHVLEALGKPRTFRLLHRVADVTLLAIGLVALVLSQLASLALHLLLRALRRLARPPRRSAIAAMPPILQYRAAGGP